MGAGSEEKEVKYITCVPGEFVLSCSNDGTPFHIYGGTGVGCHLEVGHITQRSWEIGRRNMTGCMCSVVWNWDLQQMNSICLA